MEIPFSDSRIKDVINRQIEIFDSTTISLFQDINVLDESQNLACAKEELKCIQLLMWMETIPKMIWFSHGSKNDHVLLKKLRYASNTIFVFDKGYNDYKAFRDFTQAKTGFVTRIKDNAVYSVSEVNEIEDNIHSGVLEDVIIDLIVKDKTENFVLKLRKVKFYDRTLKRTLEFLTNMFEIRPDLIAAIYKLRWQIELLFK